MCYDPFFIMSAWGGIQAKDNKTWLRFKCLPHTYQFCDVGRVKARAHALLILFTPTYKGLGIKLRAWHMLDQRSSTDQHPQPRLGLS